MPSLGACLGVKKGPEEGTFVVQELVPSNEY